MNPIKVTKRRLEDVVKRRIRMKQKTDKWNMDGCKLLWHMPRVEAHFKHKERIAPLHIDMACTKLCNASCVYCYGIKQNMSGATLSREPLLDLFRTAHQLGVKSITMTGDGENTLNPHMYDALELGKKKGLDLGLATNGIALDVEKIRKLVSTCTWLRFNLSAIGSEGYKSIHGVPQWERVQANIDTAVRINEELGSPCTIGLQMVLIPEALEYVIPEAAWAVSTGVDYFVVKQFSDPGNEEMSQFDLKWYDDDVLKSTLETAESLSNEKTQIVIKWARIDQKGKRPYNQCYDAPLLFQISGNGKCYPCGYLFGDDRYCYGDLNTQSLAEILASEHYWKLIEYMQKYFNVHKDCMGCCRHDGTNQFMEEYLNPPDHLNFI